MNDLLRSFSRFLTRDVIFMLGGLLVLASFYYMASNLRLSALPWPEVSLPLPAVLFIAVLGFAVGYAIQLVFSLLGLVTTANYFEPGAIVKFLFQRHQKQSWVQPTSFAVDAVRTRTDFAPVGVHARLERFITLKLTGTVLGPCSIVSSGIILAKAIRTDDVWDYGLAACASALGVVLIAVGWVKACEQMRYMAYIQECLPDPASTEAQEALRLTEASRERAGDAHIAAQSDE